MPRRSAPPYWLSPRTCTSTVCLACPAATVTVPLLAAESRRGTAAVVPAPLLSATTTALGLGAEPRTVNVAGAVPPVQAKSADPATGKGQVPPDERARRRRLLLNNFVQGRAAPPPDDRLDLAIQQVVDDAPPG